MPKRIFKELLINLELKQVNLIILITLKINNIKNNYKPMYLKKKNFMNKFKIFFILALLMNLGFAAEVHGTVYRWSDLETVPAMIQVTRDINSNELIHQEVLNESGMYSIELEEGEYFFYVSHDDLSSSQNLSITEEESRRIDFILTPEEDYLFPIEPLPEYDEYGEIPLPEDSLVEEPIEENVTDPEDPDYRPIIGEEEASELTIYLAILVFVTMISLTYFLKKRSEEARGSDYTQKPIEDEEKDRKHIKTDEEEIIDILKEKEEVYQSEIKKETGFSAAKTSELLSKMEKEDKIIRDKKGRNKIVKLKED